MVWLPAVRTAVSLLPLLITKFQVLLHHSILENIISSELLAGFIVLNLQVQLILLDVLIICVAVISSIVESFEFLLWFASELIANLQIVLIMMCDAKLHHHSCQWNTN